MESPLKGGGSHPSTLGRAGGGSTGGEGALEGGPAYLPRLIPLHSSAVCFTLEFPHLGQ